MRKRIVRLVSVLVLISCLIFSIGPVYAYGPDSFSDVPTTHWAYAQIMSMARQEILKGYPDGTFKPDKYVSREEFAIILCGATSVPLADPNSNTFADIPTDHWAFKSVETVKDYLVGYPSSDNGKPLFKGKQDATREDVAVALVKIKGFDKTVSPNPNILNDMFKDTDSISSQLKNLVAIAVEKQLISGYPDNTIRGTQTLTRAEAAALIDRANKIAGDIKGSTGTNNTGSAKLTYLTLACSKSTGKVGEALTATAKGIYSNEQTRDVTREVKWTSSNTAIMTINEDGEISLKKAGTAKIIAVLEDKSDDQEITVFNNVTVSEPVIKSILVTPQTKEIKVNDSVTLKAEATYDKRRSVNVTNDAKWESSNSDVVIVNSQGKVVGLKGGTVLIKATYKNTIGYAAITVVSSVYTPPQTVSPITLESISPSTNYQTVSTGSTVKVEAVGNYSDNSKKDITASSTWTTDNNQIASIVNPGEIKGISKGVAKITISKDGKSNFLFVVVTED